MIKLPQRGTKRLLGSLTEEYQKTLQGSLGESYLLSRGISKEAQNFFQLGFVTDPSPENRMFRERISIPYTTRSGVVGIKYRSISIDNEPKYLNSIGFNARSIYNALCLTEPVTTIFICEGELDTITLYSLGVPAVGVPGANSWNPVLSRALRNRRCVVLADGDDKGQGRGLATEILKSVDDGTMIVMEGTDVNQFYVDHGKDKLLDYIGWSELD